MFLRACQNPRVQVSRPCKIDIAQDDKVPLHHTFHLNTLQVCVRQSRNDDLYLFLPERPYNPHAMYATTKLTAKKPVSPGRYCSAGPAENGTTCQQKQQHEAFDVADFFHDL